MVSYVYGTEVLGKMPVAFDPKADYSIRNKLLRICLDRGLSQGKIKELVEPMRDLPHEEKELMAAELISIVESGIYDCYPRHFYHKIEWYDSIRRLHDRNDIIFDTLRSVVEEMLRYCKISEDTIENIFSLLCTEESLWQMYNWLMDQRYVPDEVSCIVKAKDICSVR